MLKILATSGVLLLIFIVPNNVANAGLFDWVSQNNATLDKVYDNLKELQLTREEIKQDEKVVEEVATKTETKPAIKARVAKNAETKRTMVVLATAYSSTPDQTDNTPFVTAWNTRVRDGIIAANFLPFGTEIRIPEIFGDKIFVVEDRMHQRFFHRVDVWFPERDLAKEFGVKKVTIEVI